MFVLSPQVNPEQVVYIMEETEAGAFAIQHNFTASQGQSCYVSPDGLTLAVTLSCCPPHRGLVPGTSPSFWGSLSLSPVV